MFVVALLGISLLNGVVFAAPSIQNRVVNGSNSDIEKWPFMVSLRRSHRHSCGGTAIHPNWVLTAAHCTQGAAGSFTIRHSSTHAQSGSTSGDVIQVSQIINHKGYNPINRFINDIALIRLNEPISLQKYIQLPEQFTEYEHGTPAVLLGWGVNKTNGPVMDHLQEVDLIVFSDEECARRHSTSPPHPSNICGGVPEGGKGQCNGDSGGPLIVDGIHVGIVSWSIKPCTVYPYPGVYTKVSHYREWIREVSGV